MKFSCLSKKQIKKKLKLKNLKNKYNLKKKVKSKKITVKI